MSLIAPDGQSGFNAKIRALCFATICGSVSFSPATDQPSGLTTEVHSMTRQNSLRTVPASPPPADRLPVATQARSELQSLRQALQDARGRAADLAGVLQRAETVGRRAAEVHAALERLEREATEPMAAWVRRGAIGEPPALTPAEQTALDEARRAAERAQRDCEAVEATLPALRQQLAELQILAPQIERQIRKTALAVLAERYLARTVSAAVEAERAATTAREQAFATLEFLDGAGYQASVVDTGRDRFGNPINVAVSRIERSLKELAEAREAKPDPALSENHITTLRTELERLVRGEE